MSLWLIDTQAINMSINALKPFPNRVTILYQGCCRKATRRSNRRNGNGKEANELDKEYNLNKQFLSEIGSKEKQTEEQLKDQVRALRREVEKEQEGHKKERREILDSAKAFIKKEKEGVDSLFGEMDVQKRWLQESLAKAKSVAKKEEKLQRHFEDKLKRGKETKRGQ